MRKKEAGLPCGGPAFCVEQNTRAMTRAAVSTARFLRA